MDKTRNRPKKCPRCGSSRVSNEKGYFSCAKCGFLNIPSLIHRK